MLLQKVEVLHIFRDFCGAGYLRLRRFSTSLAHYSFFMTSVMWEGWRVGVCLVKSEYESILPELGDHRRASSNHNRLETDDIMAWAVFGVAATTNSIPIIFGFAPKEAFYIFH
jgi:hypothetical protein